MIIQFLGGIILLLTGNGLAEHFTLSGVIWFIIGLVMIAPHVAHDLIMEAVHSGKRK